jgi:hypothetical protein
MTHDEIDALARKAGALPEAIQDVKSRVLARFAGEEPEPATVEAWVRSLARTVPHLFPLAQTLAARLGMTEETFNKMPPTWRLEQGRSEQTPVTKPHVLRPTTRNLTEAELAALDAEQLSWWDRLAKARAMQQTPR